MTFSGRAGSIRRNRRSASQVIVAGLVVLAVVASLFLIFGDSVQILRIGLVAALWAAVVGAIAMTKYRRESAADKAKIRDLQTVYQLQLEREVTARREYEAGVEARVRSETSLEASEIAALRAELAALRGSLEVLFEGRLPADRVAIESDGTRRGELGPAAAVPFAPKPAYADPGAGPKFASPDDEPVTAEVDVVPEDDTGPIPVPGRTPGPVPARGRVDSSAPVTANDQPEAPEPSDETPASDVEEQAEPDLEPAEPDPTGQPGHTAESPAQPPTTRGGRRRAAEGEEGDGAHSSGLTVAEILANVRAEKSDADGPRQGRRRRE